ncbi:STAS domain-containing protein [Planosporangium thailandense]|uniref:Anti-sigma factor antagonist n=1 Tax=Planosporangium thailandense TaxID=765197 RepID=A0ABX0Y8F7_9ACTN|nr:STAS domain-containing protein [Planosporangium thailandense]
MSLSIQTRRQSEREALITLHGEVDYATALELRAVISAILSTGDVDKITLDLAGVTHLDSTGVGTLVAAARICDDVAVEFQICQPNPFIATLFTVMGVAEMLGIPAAPTISPRTLRARVPSPASRVA